MGIRSRLRSIFKGARKNKKEEMRSPVYATPSAPEEPSNINNTISTDAGPANNSDITEIKEENTKEEYPPKEIPKEENIKEETLSTEPKTSTQANTEISEPVEIQTSPSEHHSSETLDTATPEEPETITSPPQDENESDQSAEGETQEASSSSPLDSLFDAEEQEAAFAIYNIPELDELICSSCNTPAFGNWVSLGVASYACGKCGTPY